MDVQLVADSVLTNLGEVRSNLSVARLYEEIIRNGEAKLAKGGAVVTETGKYTGRSPNDKFIVSDADTKDSVWWKEAHPFTAEQFEHLRQKQAKYLEGKRVYVRDVYAGADPEHRLNVRVVNETAWHNLFVSNMFIAIDDAEELASFAPGFTVVHTPYLQADPATDGTNSEVAVCINFAQKMILIMGSRYAGEIKKSIFTVLNYMLPAKGVLGMHCSANVGADGSAALFFGLSGTGKTTLSADSERALIGDDEHGWSDQGTFNFEGGCYAKVIRLSAEAEPEIYATTSMYGTILENVIFADEDQGTLDLDDATLTQNTRASYPLTSIPNIAPGSRGGHPKTIIMLTCDAFGVLPPIARLTPDQAMYHFMAGYTAKVAGTERGVTEPRATFSACFGAPFMARHPAVYAKLLGEKMEQHGAECWLLNTGWTGGPYGVGSRISIKYSRALIRAALSGELSKIGTTPDPVFGIGVPASCPGVPDEVLQPRNTWEDKNAYDERANHLADMFQKNFAQYDEVASDAVKAAGPQSNVKS